MLGHIAYRFNSSARRDTKYQNLSLLWFQKTYNELEQSALARSILAGEHDEFAAMHMKGDISEYLYLAISKAQVMAPDSNILWRMRQSRFNNYPMLLAIHRI
jgi:hypothetical protein